LPSNFEGQIVFVLSKVVKINDKSYTLNTNYFDFILACLVVNKEHMPIIDLDEYPKAYEFIKEKLAEENLLPDNSEEWEVHGQYETMGPVYVGGVYRNPIPGAKCRCRQKTKTGHMAFCQASRQYFCVVVSDDGIKFIDDPRDWAKPEKLEN
jgi:hypothetical protein